MKRFTTLIILLLVTMCLSAQVKKLPAKVAVEAIELKADVDALKMDAQTPEKKVDMKAPRARTTLNDENDEKQAQYDKSELEKMDKEKLEREMMDKDPKAENARILDEHPYPLNLSQNNGSRAGEKGWVSIDAGDYTPPTGSYHLPISPYYGYTYSQTIYLQSEIAQAGKISSIKYNLKSTSLTNSNTWEVYMGHTAKGAFDGASDWIATGGLTKVYDGTFTAPTASGWFEIELSTPFIYNNTDNLVVAVYEKMNSYGSSTQKCKQTQTIGVNRGLIYAQDALFTIATATEAAAKKVADYYANIQLFFKPPYPEITYTPLANTTSTAERTLTATITDPDGVGSGANAPVLYHRLSPSGTWAHVAGTLNGANTYDFVIPASTYDAGNKVEYFVAAQDNASTPNVGSNPEGAVFTVYPTDLATAPATPNSYIISQSISGNINVGVEQTHTTIQGALDHIASNVMVGAVTLTLMGDAYTESSITINPSAGMSDVNTLTIKPAAGKTPTITLSSAAGLTINASHVIIDGSNTAKGTDRSLTITNTSTASNAITISNPASGVTIKNSIISGDNSITTSCGIKLAGGTTAASDGIAVSNCVVKKAYTGISLAGVSTSLKATNITIENSTIGDATDVIAFKGILATNTHTLTIKGCDIFGDAAGSTITSKAGVDIGSTCDATTINANKIHDFFYSGTSGWGCFGVLNAGANTTIANNMIWSIKADGDAVSSLSWVPAGIRLDGGANPKVYYNTVRLTHDLLKNAGACLTVTSTVTGIGVCNNIFVNSMTGTSTTAIAYGIVSAAASSAFTTLDHNAYLINGKNAKIGYIGGAAKATLADWQTATGKEENSKENITVAFVADNDLHINPLVGTDISNAGMHTDAVTTDFDGDARHASTPDIGADEGNFKSPGPSITYTPLGNVIAAEERVLLAIIKKTVNDLATGANVPRLYYRVAPSGSWAFDEGEATANADEFSFTIPAGTGAPGNRVEYFVAASDNADNTSSVPAGATFNPTYPTLENAPTTLYSYYISQPISGQFFAGIAETYITIQAALDFFADNYLVGPVTLFLSDPAYAENSITVKPILGLSDANTLTIKPVTGIMPTITLNSAAGFAINASHVIIDGSNAEGGVTNDLTITNTSTASNAITINNPASSVIIKFCVISGNNLSSSSCGIKLTGGTTAASNGITVANCVVKKAYTGISLAGVSSSLKATNIKINNCTIGDATDVIAKIGIAADNTENLYIYGCDIFGDAAGSTSIYSQAGINIGLGCNVTTIERNTIHDFYYSGTGEWGCFGVQSAGASTTIANNMIWNIKADGYSATASSVNNPNGIYIAGGAGVKVLYNTVKLTHDAVNKACACLAIAAGSNLEVCNNIFVNSMTGTANTKTFGIGSAVAASAFTSLSNNAYLIDGTAPNIGYIGSAAHPTLAAWQAATGKDANSLEGVTLPFVSETNLHITPGALTEIEGAGLAIETVTNDIDGDARHATKPDIGADEGDFVLLDITAPAIAYTPLASTIETGERILLATITDASGIASGANAPVLYHRLDSTGTWAHVQGTLTENANVYSFTMPGYPAGSMVQYFVAAMDSYSTPNIGSKPAGATFTTYPGELATAPTTPASYIVLSGISGVKTVGATGADFNGTIAEAIATIKDKHFLTGPLTLSLIDATYTEPDYIALDSISMQSAINRVTIKPAAGVNATINSDVEEVFSILGKYYTIDGSNSEGGTTKNLTLVPSFYDVWTIGVCLYGGTNITIKNCNITTHDVTLSSSYGIFINNVDLDNVVIENNTITKARMGIRYWGNLAAFATNGTIRGNIIGSATPADYVTYTGIYVSYADGLLIEDNEIMGPASGNAIIGQVGIGIGDNSKNITINANRIHDFNFTGSAANTRGTRGILVDLVAGNEVVITNNMIWNILSPGAAVSSMSTMPCGIWVGASSTKLYHNSINLTGTLTGTGCSMCLGVLGTPTIDARNNIFRNAMTGAGTGNAFLVIVSATNANATFNHNIYSNAAGVNPKFGRIATTNYDDLAAWQTATSQDATSYQDATVAFVSDIDLHIRADVATHVESNATPIATVTKDIDGDGRHATKPDIGADEGTFMLLDDQGPIITFTPLANTISTEAVTLTAIITDISGINATNAPTLFWKLSTSPDYSSVTGTSTANANEYQFVIPGAELNKTVEYFVTAQDAVTPTANVSSMPAGAVFGPYPTLTTAPATVYSYKVLPALFGTKTVGTSGADFNGTIADAIASIKADYVITGAVTLLLKDPTYTEAAGVIIEGIAGLSAINTLTIKPADNVTPTITVTQPAGYNGGIAIKQSYVTIDGANNLPGKSLTIVCNSSFSAAIGIANPVDNVNVKMCNVTGSGTSTGNYGIRLSGGTGASNAIAIDNNSISKAYIGVDIAGISSTQKVSNIHVFANTIGDVTTGDHIEYYGIQAANVDNMTIEGNEIFGDAAGSALYSKAGVYLGANCANSAIVGNLIHDFYYTNTSKYGCFGIRSNETSNSNITIANNMIWNIKADGEQISYLTGASVPQYYPAGIYVGGGSGYNIYYNTINLSGNYLCEGGCAANLVINSGVTGIDVRNNIFVNTMTGNTTGIKGAIFSKSPATAFTHLDNNVYFVDGTNPNIGYIGGAQATLAAWQTATGMDAAAVVSQPVFAAGDLSIADNDPANVLVHATGQPIAAVTTDIYGDARSATEPCAGADEWALNGIGMVTFTVKNATTNAPISGATITMNSKTHTTNALGVAKVGDINGTHNYTVNAPEFNEATGTVTINNDKTTKDVNMEVTTYTITFTVTNSDGGAAVEGVLVKVGAHEATTNASGVATFTLPHGNYSYTATATGFVDIAATNFSVSANADIAFEMTLKTYTIGVTVGTNGTMTPDVDQTVNYGSTPAFTATANTGYVIDALMVDGTAVPAAAGLGTYTYTFAAISNAHTIAVTFKVATYTIGVTVGANGTMTPGADQTVNYGATPVFSIAANEGFVIDELLVDGVAVVAAAGLDTYTYNFAAVTAAHTIAVTFKHTIYTITASAGANGTITPSGVTDVEHGSTPAFVITADAGYMIDELLVDGSAVLAAANIASYTYTFEAVVSDGHTIAVTFKVATYTIGVTVGANGTMTPSVDQTVNYGATPTFSVTANAGFVIDELLVDGIAVPAAAGLGTYTYNFAAVTDAHTIAVTFKHITHTITASAGANGSITPTGAVSVNHGENKTFSVLANSGFVIDELKIDDVAFAAASGLGAYNYTFTGVIADGTIAVTFMSATTPVLVALMPISEVGEGAGTGTINVTNNGTGTMDWSASVTQGGTWLSISSGASGTNAGDITCAFTANDGVQRIGKITITAIGAAGSPCEITVTQAAKTYTIAATAGANGTITPTGATTVNHGATPIFTATANVGFVIDALTVDGVAVDAAAGLGTYTYTFGAIDAGHTINVTFKHITYIIVATAAENGTITPSGNVTVAHGSSQAFDVVANTGYLINTLKVNGVVIGVASNKANYTYTFPSVTANGNTIEATFKAKTYTITATAGANGTITPTGATTVNHGSTPTFTATANEGYVIEALTVDGVAVVEAAGQDTYTYNFAAVTAAHTVVVTFKVKTYTITASAGANGTITPTGTATVNHGATPAYAIAASAGYVIDELLVDGVAVAAATGLTSYTYNFTAVTAVHTIAVTFKIMTYTITATAGENGTITPTGATTVNHGATPAFVATANVGYVIEALTVDGVAVTGAVGLGTYTYTFTAVTSAHTIAVTFKIKTYTITASAGANGTITPTGATTVNHGATPAYAIAANVGYVINVLKVDGTVVADAAGLDNYTYTFAAVTAPHTIAVTFKVKTYTITASAGANGTITPTGATTVNHGATPAFAIAASAGYVIDELKVDGVAVAAATGLGTYTYTFTAVTAAHTIAATFKVKTYTITATAGENGTITPTGATTVNHGATPAFVATANEGYVINDLKVDGVAVAAAAGLGTYTYTFTAVTAAHTIAVTFKPSTHIITATAGENGTITPTGATTVNTGSTPEFVATANEGYVINDLKVDGVAVDAAADQATYTYTFAAVNADHTIAVTFKVKTYTITATAGENGTITPSGEVVVSHGANQEFAIAANENYQIDSLVVDGVKVPAATEQTTYTYTFESVSASHTIAVIFKVKVGVETPVAVTVKMYPNPVSSSLNIESAETIGTVQVFDASGRIIHSEQSGTTKLQLNTGNWSSGVYTIRISTRFGFSTHRVVKQ